jgi:hypothetical protein
MVAIPSGAVAASFRFSATRRAILSISANIRATPFYSALHKYLKRRGYGSGRRRAAAPPTRPPQLQRASYNVGYGLLGGVSDTVSGVGRTGQNDNAPLRPADAAHGARPI